MAWRRRQAIMWTNDGLADAYMYNCASMSLNIHCIGRGVLVLVLVSPFTLLSGVPDYFGRNKISSGGDLSHYSSASLY